MSDEIPQTEQPAARRTIFGIDLGTTYSCISKVDEFDRPHVLLDERNLPVTPSVVWFNSDTEYTVGEDAKAMMDTDKVIASKFKRKMEDDEWKFLAFGKGFGAIELSKLVLERLAEAGKMASGEPVKDVVITCPAYFGAGPRGATKQAGQLAGLNVLAVIPEPTAAAISHALHRNVSETVLVYDLGGGTFDVSIVQITPDRLSVRYVTGDVKLGGVDWDADMLRLLVRAVADKVGKAPSAIEADKRLMGKLRVESEKVKISLTTAKTAHARAEVDGETEMVSITLDEFEAATKHLLDRTIGTVRRALAGSEKNGNQPPTRIVAVGGSSIMTQVRKRLEEEFPGMEIDLKNPHESVALGAAIYANDRFNLGLAYGVDADEVVVDPDSADAVTPSGNPGIAGGMSLTAPPKSRVFEDVTPYGYGVGTFDDNDVLRVYTVYHANTAKPGEADADLYTYQDKQANVSVIIYEVPLPTTDEERWVDIDQSKEVAQGVLELGGVYDKGEPLQLKIKISEEGLLTAVATHPRSGHQLPLSVKVHGVLSPVELERRRVAMQGMRPRR